MGPSSLKAAQQASCFSQNPWHNVMIFSQCAVCCLTDTELVLDETALSEGQLAETGIANVMALQSVLSWQRLSYDFQFHQSDFPTNLVRSGSRARDYIADDSFVPRMNLSSR